MDKLISTFDTEFLQKILNLIVKEASTPHIAHVGSLESWPEQMGDCACLIFNTEYSTEPGEHWVAVYVANQSAYIFDSLPLRPFPHIILSKLGKICNNIENVNPQHFVLQHPDYPLCGLYCLMFLERFSKGYSLYLCPNNRLMNDVTVVEHVLPYIKSAFLKNTKQF